MHGTIEGVELTALTPSPSRGAPIKKAVFELVKKMVEWKVTGTLDEENSWLLEGRTVLISKGGDMKDPANYRPITCLPTITKAVTLAIHKRMQKCLFGNGERGILELSQRLSEHQRRVRCRD